VAAPDEFNQAIMDSSYSVHPAENRTPCFARFSSTVSPPFRMAWHTSRRTKSKSQGQPHPSNSIIWYYATTTQHSEEARAERYLEGSMTSPPKPTPPNPPAVDL
jgi:hypothetical protein